MNAVTDMIRRKALYEGVADSIRDRIFEHILPPGSIIDELSLAKHYGVSRTPVREAIKVLVNEGLLTMTIYQGCCVAEVSREDLIEILDVVEMLDDHALRQIVQHPDKSKLLRLFDECEPNAKASPGQPDGGWSSFCQRVRDELGNTPFATVSRNLQQQLRLCLGPMLDHADIGAPPDIQAVLLQAMRDGDLQRLSRYGHIRAEGFRAAVLAAFDRLSQERVAQQEPV